MHNPLHSLFECNLLLSYLPPWVKDGKVWQYRSNINTFSFLAMQIHLCAHKVNIRERVQESACPKHTSREPEIVIYAIYVSMLSVCFVCAGCWSRSFSKCLLGIESWLRDHLLWMVIHDWTHPHLCVFFIFLSPEPKCQTLRERKNDKEWWVEQRGCWP